MSALQNLFSRQPVCSQSADYFSKREKSHVNDAVIRRDDGVMPRVLSLQRSLNCFFTSGTVERLAALMFHSEMIKPFQQEERKKNERGGQEGGGAWRRHR